MDELPIPVIWSSSDNMSQYYREIKRLRELVSKLTEQIKTESLKHEEALGEIIRLSSERELVAGEKCNCAACGAILAGW
jgi:uncharacterized protein with PIN domain